MKRLLLVLMFGVFFLGCKPDASEPSASTAESGSSRSGELQVSTTDSEDILREGIRRSRGIRNERPPAIPLDPTAMDDSNDDRFPTKFLSWNVESEGANSDVIVAQLQEMNLNDRYDVVALSEVMPQDLAKYRLALGKHYKYVFSKSGFNDRLQLLYNEDRFEEVRKFELTEININNRYRGPVVLHLRERKADENGTKPEMLVMLNHLARGKAEIREQQAEMLVAWARDQTLPVIALGDYNLDFVFETRKGNPAFLKMLNDNVWRWIEPAELVDTNWFDNPSAPDGKDDYPGSMLDFAFVAGPAKNFTYECNVIVRDGDFPDDETTSDHRPFELLFAR